MANGTALERLKDRIVKVKDEVIAAKSETKTLKKLYQTVISDANAPATVVADDMIGSLIGIGLWRGSNAAFNKLGQQKPGENPGFLKRNGWFGELVQAGTSAAAYTVNLATHQYGFMSMGQTLVRRASMTQFTFALDALLVRAYRYMTLPKPPAQLAPAAQPPAAPSR